MLPARRVLTAAAQFRRLDRLLDEAAERAWQDRAQSRLLGPHRLVARLAQEGTLRRGLDAAVAADLLWTMTSLRTSEGLVWQRGWSATQYEKNVGAALQTVLMESAIAQ